MVGRPAPLLLLLALGAPAATLAAPGETVYTDYLNKHAAQEGTTKTLSGLQYNDVTLKGGVTEAFRWTAGGIEPIRFHVDDIRWVAEAPSGTCGE